MAQRIAVLLIIVLAAQPFGAAAQILDKRQEAIKDQLKKIHKGKSIEVTLQQEGNRKIRGKLISVGEESFDIRTEKSGRASTERVEFASVKSVKKRGMSTAAKVLIVAGIAVALGLTLYAVRPGRSAG
jgi:biopolymer transport protein ExbD